MGMNMPNLSMRSYLYILLVLLVVVTLLSVGGIFVYFGDRATQQLGWKLQEQVMSQVQNRLHDYMRTASRINESNKVLYEDGYIAVDDYEAWARQFKLQAKQFDFISYITVSSAQGSWFGLRNTEVPVFFRLDGQGKLYRYDKGTVDQILSSQYFVQDQKMPASGKNWFTASVEAGRPVWSEIYSWSDQSELAISLGDPVLDQQKNVSALFSVDLSLTSISDFLRQFRIGKTGGVFIVDRQGLMIASSTFQAPYRKLNQRLQRLAVSEYGNDMISTVGRHLQDKSSILTQTKYSGDLSWQGRELQILSEPFYTASGLDWLVVAVVPSDELTASVRDGMRWALIGGALFLLLTLLVAGSFANRWSRPLIKLATKVEEIRWLNLNQDFQVDADVAEIKQLGNALQRMQAGLQSFARFVPRDIVRQILNDGEAAELGGEKRMVTVMFADIQGYSTVAEQLDPEQTLSMLNQYFQAMQDVVAMYGGTVIEHMGDSVVAVFGAPHLLQDHSANAVRSALDMQEALEKLNSDWNEKQFGEIWQNSGLEQLSMRIGLHRGAVVAGNIGGTEYMKYGVIGDVVNVASRLEGLNKEHGSQMMISRQVYESLETEMMDLFLYHGVVTLKGRSNEQVVYRLKN